MDSTQPSAFTGRSRNRKTKPAIKYMDGIARTLITIGGLGTIVAVATVCVFLVYETIPLFLSPSVKQSTQYPQPWAAEHRTADQIVHTLLDEYQVLGASVFRDGSVQVFRVDDGKPLGASIRLFGDKPATAYHFSSDRDDASFGFADGTARLGNMGIKVSFVHESQLSESVREIPVESAINYEQGVLFRTRTGQFRYHHFSAEFGDPIGLSTSSIRLIAHSIRNTGPVIVALGEDDQLALNSIFETRNFLTGKVTPSVTKALLPYEPPTGENKPSHLLISGLGDTVYLAWESGLLHRFDTRSTSNIALAEKVRVVEDQSARLTVLKFMIGRTTLVAGDTSGQVRAWFRIKPDKATTSDGQYLVPSHDLGNAGSPVTAIAASARSRIMAAGFADGRFRLYQVTVNNLLAEVVVEKGQSILGLAMGAKDDGLLAITATGVSRWLIDKKHPAINIHAVFGPVWYEGYEKPEHLWQSSSGTDDFEPKYGLVPLVFGTLKATFYSMLFGLPLAIIAAIYTSEFLHPRVKARIKPTIEMMASLPSVVLGFLAALVIAPVIEQVVPGALMLFVTVPFCLLIGAFIWQLIPEKTSIVMRPHRLWFITATLPFAVVMALGLGPWPGLGVIIESLLFAGNIKLYLDGQIGSGFAGWFILLLPISGIASGLLSGAYVNPFLRARSAHWTRTTAAVIDLGKFLLLLLLTLLIAGLIALLLVSLGWDPRGAQLHDFLGTYVQRNALVVGFIMGFAIIPIIYTLTEDALSAVPEHLRSASLGCGATPWQTATRIIVPTAMSGIFSAMMIGLGRAVGETMIVLMAAGNTPVMQMNIFNGFRTLSANIAVELPEAPVGGTHYRVLFLAALTLFVMTFAVNTLAESVRQRFRKRAFQL